jgi:predicted dehydrogenase
VGWKESKCRRLDDAEWTVFGKGYDKVQAFRSQIDNFARAIRGEESLVITADDAVASVEVIHAAYQALNSPQWTLVLNGVGQTEADELASLAAEPA